jgi:hypothetical protein
MTHQQLTQAPGEPIGYAPIYAPAAPPLASAPLPPPTQGNAGESSAAKLVMGASLAAAGIACLFTWGVVDQLYAGADIRAMERAATTANATAEAAEQRAASAAANAQQWEQFSTAQGQTIDGVRALVCK